MTDAPSPPVMIDKDSMVEAWRTAVQVIKDSSSGEIPNLIITVDKPSEEIPAELQGQKDIILRRVDELLGVQPPDDLLFTHGARILRWGSDTAMSLPEGPVSINQLDDYVIPVLQENPHSRRAMVLLGNPAADQTAAARSSSVPAPQVIQFDLRGDSLQVTTYYRAHEVYFFWVVNFIELVRLQRRVCESLPGVILGPITTISHNAYLNSAAFDLDRKDARLPIERSELNRLTDDDLAQLLGRVVSHNVDAINELDDLITADLNREGVRSLRPEAYRKIASRALDHSDEAHRTALELSGQVDALVARANSLTGEEKAREFLKAKGLCRRLTDALQGRHGEGALILAVEGLNSNAQWLLDLGNALGSQYPEAIHRLRRFRIGLRDVLPGRLGAKLEEFRAYYEAEALLHRATSPKISVVCHSYGSLIVTAAAQQFPDLKLDKVILVGSVVPENFNWNAVTFDRVLNEVGRRDWVASVAALLVPGMGQSGRKGFKDTFADSTGRPRVINIAYDRGRHSDTLTELHMIERWIPFLRDGDVQESAGARVIEVPRK